MAFGQKEEERMRNIDTYGRFIIDEAQCDICAGVYHDTVFAEIEKRHPEWRDSPGVVKKEYHKTWNAAYDDSPERMCFVFEADCHGDAISLCAEHLKDIVAKVEESAKEERDR